MSKYRSITTLWLDYRVVIEDGTGRCGLCNNTGETKLFNNEVSPCICPNGRAIRRHQRREAEKKVGASKDIIEVTDG